MIDLAPAALAHDLQASLQLEYAPVGFRYADAAPPGARGFGSGSGCIAPLVRAAAKGTTFVLTPEACGRPCAAFYLGFSASIFPGIELFLSDGPLPGRDCERFLRTPELAREFLESVRFEAPPGKVAVLAPLSSFAAGTPPEIVIMLGNADQVSALVFLLHHDAPTDDRRVVTQFASACASMITLPLRMAHQHRTSAVWGLHDISARSHLPAHLTSVAMPLNVLEAAWRYAPTSFLSTSHWSQLAARNRHAAAQLGDES